MTSVENESLGRAFPLTEGKKGDGHTTPAGGYTPRRDHKRKPPEAGERHLPGAPWVLGKRSRLAG